MNQFLATILTIPSILLTLLIVWIIFTGRDPWTELGIPPALALMPALSFPTCVAFIFVFRDSKPWKIAAAITSIPFVLLAILALIFALGGYHMFY